jgi:hypothetical protein
MQILTRCSGNPDGRAASDTFGIGVVLTITQYTAALFQQFVFVDFRHGGLE